MERLETEIESGLSTLGLKPQRLTSEEVLHLLYEQWNPTRNVSLGRVNPDNIRSSVLFTDVGVDDRGFSMSDYHYRVISLKMLPDQTYALMAAKLRELPFDTRVFVTVHVPNQKKELDSLQTQRRIAFSMVAGKKTGVADLESEAKLKDLETLLEEMVAQGEKVFHLSLQVLVRSRNEKDLEEKVSETLTKIRELASAEAMEETLATFDIFAEIALPNA